MIKERLLYLLPHDIRRKLYSTIKHISFESLQSMRMLETNIGSSYKPCDQNKCIFVHIPKAAGVSVSRTLFGNLCGDHTTSRMYQIIFSKKEYVEYFKFSFVRNPWDRVYSAFHFLQKGGMNHRDKEWSSKNIMQFSDFEEFITIWLNKSNIYKYIHFKPQYEFLCLPASDKIHLDFLGFFENIEKDFDFIRDKLQLGSNVTLSHENKTSANVKYDYKNAYTEQMIEIVARVYKKDIELFGYSFDNSSLSYQLSQRDTFVSSSSR